MFVINPTFHTLSRYDPTRTLTLRQRFSAQMYKRLRTLKGIIRKAIVEQDVLGLKDGLQTMQADLTPPGYQAYAFERAQDKIDDFMDWLREQEEKGILERKYAPQLGRAGEQPWTNTYVQQAYRQGVDRSRKEMIQAGYNIPDIEEQGGLDAVFNQPYHVDRVGLMYTRTFNELKGVTQAMDQQISRTLAQGIAEGINPREMAKNINGGIDKIGLTRARTIARTETIRAHHGAMVQEYKNWQVEGVKVKAEWDTAGDARVCPICRPLDGNVYTVEEIESMIPRHPNCRCISLPLDVTDEGVPTREEVVEEIAKKKGIEDESLMSAALIRKELLEHEDSFKKEYAVITDSRGNVVKRAEGVDEHVAIPDHPDLYTVGARLQAHHNHPVDFPPSVEGDISQLMEYPGIENMWVHTPTRSFRLSVLIDNDLAERQSREIISNAYQKAVKADIARRKADKLKGIERTIDEEREWFFNKYSMTAMEDLKEQGILSYDVITESKMSKIATRAGHQIVKEGVERIGGTPEEMLRVPLLQELQSSNFDELSKHRIWGKIDSQDPEDITLEELANIRGYDGKPTVLSADSFEEIPTSPLKRGVTDVKHKNEFVDGDYFGGKGIYGNGTYAVYGENMDAVARDYAEEQGVIIDMKLKPGAKIVDIDQLEEERKDLIRHLSQGDSDLETKFSVVLKDPGRAATMLGYDAIDVPSSEYMVILNRTAVFVRGK